ncbi:MAG: prepilin-type N-terminal cleavage/methylation domain-containing protein [Lachnospiraceae bacterium]|nr:prepilin-type N-terminal cleavage/methylation domain-containing protein [Lachnospiraceae bacterium]
MNNQRERKLKIGKAGYSLVELVVSLAILSIVGAAIMAFFMVSQNTYTQGAADTDMQYEAQLLSNQLQEILIDAARGVSYKYSSKLADESGTEEAGDITSLVDLEGVDVDDYAKYTTSLYVYNDADYYILNWDKVGDGATGKSGDVTLSQVKYDGTVIESPKLLASNVKTFSIDLSEVASKSVINYEITISPKDEKEYTLENKILLRNRIQVYHGSELPDPHVDDTVAVDEVVVSPSDIYVWRGEQFPVSKLGVTVRFSDGNTSMSANWGIHDADPKPLDTATGFVTNAGIFGLFTGLGENPALTPAFRLEASKSDATHTVSSADSSSFVNVNVRRVTDYSVNTFKVIDETSTTDAEGVTTTTYNAQEIPRVNPVAGEADILGPEKYSDTHTNTILHPGEKIIFQMAGVDGNNLKVMREYVTSYTFEDMTGMDIAPYTVIPAGGFGGTAAVGTDVIFSDQNITDDGRVIFTIPEDITFATTMVGTKEVPVAKTFSITLTYTDPGVATDQLTFTKNFEISPVPDIPWQVYTGWDITDLFGANIQKIQDEGLTINLAAYRYKSDNTRETVMGYIGYPGNGYSKCAVDGSPYPFLKKDQLYINVRTNYTVIDADDLPLVLVYDADPDPDPSHMNRNLINGVKLYLMPSSKYSFSRDFRVAAQPGASPLSMIDGFSVKFTVGSNTYEAFKDLPESKVNFSTTGTGTFQNALDAGVIDNTTNKDRFAGDDGEYVVKKIYFNITEGWSEDIKNYFLYAQNGQYKNYFSISMRPGSADKYSSFVFADAPGQPVVDHMSLYENGLDSCDILYYEHPEYNLNYNTLSSAATIKNSNIYIRSVGSTGQQLQDNTGYYVEVYAKTDFLKANAGSSLKFTYEGNWYEGYDSIPGKGKDTNGNFANVYSKNTGAGEFYLTIGYTEPTYKVTISVNDVAKGTASATCNGNAVVSGTTALSKDSKVYLTQAVKSDDFLFDSWSVTQVSNSASIPVQKDANGEYFIMPKGEVKVVANFRDKAYLINYKVSDYSLGYGTVTVRQETSRDNWTVLGSNDKAEYESVYVEPGKTVRIYFNVSNKTYYYCYNYILSEDLGEGWYYTSDYRMVNGERYENENFIEFTMPAKDLDFTAVFRAFQYRIYPKTNSSNNEVTAQFISNGELRTVSFDNTEYYYYSLVDYGTTVTLTANETSSYGFRRWNSDEVDGLGTTTTTSFVMPAESVYIEGRYARMRTFTVNIVDSDDYPGYGSVDVTIAGVTKTLTKNANSAVSQTFTAAEGAEVSLEVKAATGYVFKRWSKNSITGSLSGTSTSFTVPNSDSGRVYAYFGAPSSRVLTCKTDGDISAIEVRVDGVKQTVTKEWNNYRITILEGSSVEITATSSKNYVRWKSVDPSGLFATGYGSWRAASTRSFTMPDSNVSVQIDGTTNN